MTLGTHLIDCLEVPAVTPVGVKTTWNMECLGSFANSQVTRSADTQQKQRKVLIEQTLCYIVRLLTQTSECPQALVFFFLLFNP